MFTYLLTHREKEKKKSTITEQGRGCIYTHYTAPNRRAPCDFGAVSAFAGLISAIKPAAGRLRNRKARARARADLGVRSCCVLYSLRCGTRDFRDDRARVTWAVHKQCYRRTIRKNCRFHVDSELVDAEKSVYLRLLKKKKKNKWAIGVFYFHSRGTWGRLFRSVAGSRRERSGRATEITRFAFFNTRRCGPEMFFDRNRFLRVSSSYCCVRRRYCRERT